MQDLANVVEDAAAVVANSAGVVTVYRGQAGQEIQLPACICHAQDGPEEPQGLGNFMVRLVVAIRSNSIKTTQEQHRNNAADIFQLFMADNIASTLSAAVANFTVIGFKDRSFRHGREEDSWLSEFEMTLYCCRSDLTA